MRTRFVSALAVLACLILLLSTTGCLVVVVKDNDLKMAEDALMIK